MLVRLVRVLRTYVTYVRGGSAFRVCYIIKLVLTCIQFSKFAQAYIYLLRILYTVY